MPLVRGCPPAELARSPAAAAIGRLAAESGLFLFDYEARVQLELPEHWLPLGRPDLGVTGLAPTWDRGVLPESKYLSFRHDLLLGSLHAGHRAKWSAHELAHGLVGFAWAPDATRLFHALAARLAEALPVALWYFFDEAGLVRCWRHAAQTEVGPAYCAACDEAAARGGGSGPRSGVSRSGPEDQRWWARGREFLVRELAAVRASIAAGRPVATPHGGVDLMGDGLSYAAAHAERLRSPEFQSYVLRFCAGDGSGRHASLEALATRVEAVAAAMVGEPPAGGALAPWTANHVACDLGWRLLQIGAETDGECDAELERLIDRLAAHAHTPVSGSARRADPAFEATLNHVVTAYEALHADYELPSPEDVFALGYPLVRGYGRSVSQIRAGLATVCPQALAALGPDADAVVRAFVQSGAEDPRRTPLGVRFAAFVARSGAGELARLEAAIGHAAPPDPYELTLDFDDVNADHFALACGVTLVDAASDVAARLFGGAPGAARHWIVRRDAGDQVGLTALSSAAAGFVRALAAGPLPIETLVAHGADTEIGALVAEGILVPVLAPEGPRAEAT